MKDKRSRKRKWLDIISNIIILGTFFYPFIKAKTQRYNALEYFIIMVKSGNRGQRFLADFGRVSCIEELNIPVDSITTIWFGILLCLCLGGLLTGICLLISLRRTPPTIVEAVRLVVMFLAACTGPQFALFITLEIMLYPLVFSLMTLGFFISVKTVDAITKEGERIRQERRIEKEKRARLAFPGRYSKTFYRLIWKNAVGQIREVVILAFSSTLIMSFIIAALGLRDIWSGNVRAVLSEGGMDGVTTIVFNFMIVFFIVSVMLLALCFQYYWKERLKNNGVLSTLGMRKTTLGRIIRIEVLLCSFFSIVVGAILGSIEIKLIKIYGSVRWKNFSMDGGFGVSVYLIGTLIVVVILWFAYRFGKDRYNAKDTIDTRGLALQKEHIPGKIAGVLAVAGALFMMAGGVGFSLRRTGEGTLVLAIIFLGILLALKGIASILLKREVRVPKLHIKNMVKNQLLRYRFQTITNYLLVLTMIHISVLFFFMLQVGSTKVYQSPEERYPYDYMCLTYQEENEQIEETLTTYQAKYQVIPMMRATAYENTTNLLFTGNGKQSFFEGVNIGISESSYRVLKEAVGKEPKKNLGLDKAGKRIHIVYQQDKATKSQPIDWLPFEIIPHVRLGTRAQLGIEDYPGREIAGEEVESLTGCFQNGRLENLIVFSDEYFEENYQSGQVESVNQMWLITVPKDQKKALEKALDQFAAAHKEADQTREYEDSRIQCLYKKGVYKDQDYEKILYRVVTTLVMIALTVMSGVTMLLKVEAELPDTKKRYEFYKQFGMHQKERNGYLRREVARFYYIPILLSAFIAPLLTGIVLKLRCYSGGDMLTYGKMICPYAGAYLMIQILICVILQKYMIGKVEGKHGK